MEPLKLAAFDADDLAVLSAHLQDAVVRVADLTYLPGQRRFALVGRRFDWEAGEREARRRLTGCHFERVLSVKTRGIDRSHPEAILNLLAITFEPGEPPSGAAILHFAGGACIRLNVECIEALMKDMGPIWAARQRPAHDVERA
ncbi:DUF2948 family protein [Enterovirga aerilata]|uniref:DUF2948 family protein n=1 Tax=Enterovirga aerilata TaxID=2730920 RepID=A0A849I580_9HYPH|nr:DUF2948 family protein [Enterovirga sp. DB1703]NNM74602.1 DUF2948 family protein [Enterovirga sp. DB1703]